jgi:hypothetical protein
LKKPIFEEMLQSTNRPWTGSENETEAMDIHEY